MQRTVVLLGVQGSGKGTQAELLARRLRIQTFSIGALFREQIAAGTQFGKLAAPFVTKGQLVPDDVTSVMLRFALQHRNDRGVILDGYPRTLGQAHFLADFRPPVVVVNVHIGDEEALRRLSGRWICDRCGKIYHATMLAVGAKRCPCGGKLIQRADDRPVTIKKRIAIYHDSTEPVIDYYRRRKRLVTIDGAQDIGVVAAEIWQAVRKQMKP